jgi:hypothetical protein
MITSLSKKIKNISFYASVVLFTVLLPVVLNLRALSSFVGATHKIGMLQEFFGLSGFLAVVLVVAWAIKQNRPLDLFEYMKILLPAVVALVWLNILSERTIKDWDYICYEGAAQSLLDGKNPYQTDLDCYYYPPFPILIFSGVYTTIQYAVTVLRGFPFEDDKAWMLIFYLYQCLQWFLVILAYFLSNRLAEKYGLQKNLSLGVVTLLFILNNPLLRTLHYFQINLWILNIAMLVLVYSTSHPFFTGLTAAIGSHIKLYPAVFIVPWSLFKDKRAIAGFVVGITAVLIFIIGSFGNLSIWLQFIENNPTHAGGHALRDNSLHSLIYNFLRVTTVIQPEDLNSLIPEMLTAFIVSLVGLWFLIRMILWYKMLKKDRDLDSSFSFEREGLFVDMVGLMLLASPVAWEHHYVLAIPVLLWTFALQIKEKQSPIASLLAFLFIFGLPTFDVFPMSYLRLTGLLILLIKSDPIHYFRRNSKFEVANTASL